MDRAHVLDSLRRHATAEGVTTTPIEGLILFRMSTCVEALPGVYPTGVCVIAQGAKRAIVGGDAHVYDREHYLCCSVPMPVKAEVFRASPEEPLLGLLLSTDTPTMVDTVLRVEAAMPGREGAGMVAPGLSVARWSDDFTQALARLLDLLDEPATISVLAEGRLRELMVTILRSEAGSSMHQALGATREISRAIAYLRTNLSAPVSIEQLAKQAGMSRAVFHRKFKATTTYSPIQFVKALRLNDAATMLAGGARAGEAAARVGYTSQSQFSREFRRHFGKAPREWAGSALPV